MDSNLAHQYLKAMGITAWLPRALEPVDVSVEPDEQHTGAATAKACSLGVGEFLEQLSSADVRSLRSANGKLLIAIEPPALNQGDLELLEKMLAAIDLDPRAQGVVEIADDGDTCLVDELSHQPPELLLVMISCNDAPALIEPYRLRHHSTRWCSVPLAFTHHPAELNRLSELKRPAWEDLKRVKAVLDGHH